MLELNDAVFALLRTAHDGSSPVLCAHNVSDQMQWVHVPAELGSTASNCLDLLSGEVYAVGQDDAHKGWTLSLPPYAVRWVRACSQH